MKTLLSILLLLFSFASFAQTVPQQNNVPWFEFSRKLSVGQRFKLPQDTASLPSGATVRDTVGLLAMKDSVLYVLYNGSWRAVGFSSADSTYINFDLPGGYIIVDGDTTDVNVVQYMNDSLIRNQYASREAKRLWVDTVRGNVIKADTIVSTNIPNQYIPIFLSGRLTGFRTIQHNAVGYRGFQRNASEGFSASDLGLRLVDSLGTTQFFAVRWDGRTTIGNGSTTNFLDIYGTASGLGNTIARIKTNSTGGDARWIAENSGTGRIYMHATSTSASLLANQGSIVVENLPKLELITDGGNATGGTSPIYLKPGGFSVTPVLSVFASNQVSIGGGTTAPSTSKIFNVVSTTKASRPYPAMTTAQRDAISSPQNGDHVYNTDASRTEYYNGSSWVGGFTLRVGAIGSGNNAFVIARNDSLLHRTYRDTLGLKSDTTADGAIYVNFRLKGSATLNFGNTSAGAEETLTITVTGAAVGDPVSLGTPATWDAGGTYHAWVSAADTVSVRFRNNSGGAIDPASGTFKVVVLKFE